MKNLNLILIEQRISWPEIQSNITIQQVVSSWLTTKLNIPHK